MNDFLSLHINYSCHGVVNTAKCKESHRIHIDPETKTLESMHEYYIPELLKSLKKSMQLFKKDKYFDIEISLYLEGESYYNQFDRLYLLHQDYKNRDNDTIDLYDYTDNTNIQAQINTMSYPAALKTLTAAINNIINTYYQEVKSS